MRERREKRTIREETRRKWKPGLPAVPAACAVPAHWGCGARLFFCDKFDFGSGAVVAAVVDKEDLVGQKIVERGANLADQRLDISGFILDWNYKGEIHQSAPGSKEELLIDWMGLPIALGATAPALSRPAAQHVSRP